MTQILALSAAALYGVADFAGGLAARSTSAWRVTAWSQLIGTPLLVVAVFVVGASEVTASDFVLGAVAGAFGLIGLVLLYTALANGSMTIVAPTVGVLAAGIPVGWDIATGGVIEPAHWIGIGMAIGAVTLLGVRPSGFSINRRVLVQAIGAAVSFAAFIIAMSYTNETAGLWPFVPARLLSIPIAFTVAARTTTAAPPSWPVLRLVTFVGLTDIAAGIAIVLAVQRGPLGISAVLSSLYPAFTVAAAIIVLKERPSSIQGAGIALAVLAVAVLAG
ncbi:MAG: EamA family transporter [Acidimicrobiia bacterium]|nr:MAG: EamA family transporter [Acidimicrobiia bacterium]